MRRREKDELARLGANLRRLRDKRGWTLDEAAEKIGFSAKTLWRIESGKSPPAFSSLVALALTYEVELRSLFS